MTKKPEQASVPKHAGRDGPAADKADSRAPRRSLHELLREVTEENRHGEIDWGQPVGREVW